MSVNDISNCISYGTARVHSDDTNLTYSGCDTPEIQSMMHKHLGCMTVNDIRIEYCINSNK